MKVTFSNLQTPWGNPMLCFMGCPKRRPQ